MKDVIVARWDTSPTAPPRQAELAALWVRSWKARGWKPRVLLFDQPVSKPFKGCALQVFHFGQINFSFKPEDRLEPFVKFGEEGWESARLVDFGPNVSPDFVIKCGIKL